MRPIIKIIIQPVDIGSIDALILKHKEEGMPMVGFHYMIGSDGNTEIGRPISAIGNHCIGENAASIGIATIGTELTKKQESTIDTLLEELETKVPEVKEVYIVENGELKKYK